MTLHSIDVEVRAAIKDGYRLKVSVLDLGLYMDGFRAVRSDRNTGGWWVQPPAVNVKGKWRSSPEFDKSLTLWQEIEQMCLEAVSEATRDDDTDTAAPAQPPTEPGDSPQGLFPNGQDYGTRYQPRRYHE
jgi:hypothetical protein